MSGELSFFELGVSDPERARDFYGTLFGWEFEETGPGKGFAIATPTVPGGVHGGDEGASPYLFFAVDDIEAASVLVRDLGGEAEALEGEDDETQRKFGRFILCKDDQGSAFGLHEPPSSD